MVVSQYPQLNNLLKHSGTRNISSGRILLRQFAIEDDTSMFNNWAKDSEVTRYLRWKPHKSVSETSDIIKKWLSSYRNQDFYHWCITINDTGEAIGSITVINYDSKQIKCEIGYCLSRKFWNQGIMTETLKTVIDYLLNTVKFQTIESFHHLENTASGKVMIKAGMKYEGIKSNYSTDSDGNPVDVKYYSLNIQ